MKMYFGFLVVSSKGTLQNKTCVPKEVTFRFIEPSLDVQNVYVSFNIVYLCSDPKDMFIILNDPMLTFNMVVLRVELKVQIGCS